MNEPSCCTTSEALTSCPACGARGKTIKLITLKALLLPHALTTLEPAEHYRFCPDAACEVTYFSDHRAYSRADVKVPVYQKDPGDSVPVCYCFAYTRRNLELAAHDESTHEIPRVIQDHIKAGRCGCEVNNPQGSCCLGNVNKALTRLREAKPPPLRAQE
ncbi:putative iron-sulfur cluster-binding metallochaperone [Deinococcus peraridilitoris]|uniref:CopZ zinc binding domain-containing protein n=1 Tax=Deinococcus peraridilitoris (strain DSM 19664 / LMG 22246 / CIP 109416 / KR-200) TaxID=937777 RepID=L0A9I7_DEIPD|nr:copper chaperone Copz family protein [Deinococcus peraridilitoris]AFZ69710.1 hypothetical protein Deipe_4372 [Deinococcus peraridilitoris DSM 19664]